MTNSENWCQTPGRQFFLEKAVFFFINKLLLCSVKREREIDRQTDRDTDR